MNGPVIKPPEGWQEIQRHPLSGAYPDIEGPAWKDYLDTLKTHGVVGDRRVTIYENKVLDGWQLLRGCKVVGIIPRFQAPPPEIDPETFVQIVNDHRRHESQDQANARIEARRERIATLREQGESVRAIAKKEGVSASQVRRDLSTAPGGAVEPKTRKITGLDGKTREVPAQIFCPRCNRIGPVKDCPNCAELRAKKPKTTKPKQGKPLFSFREWEKDFGKVVRGMTQLAKAYNDAESADHTKAEKLLTAFFEHFTAWHKKLTKK